MVADDALNDVQSKARAFADWLCREERLEHAALHVSRNARTVVGDLDQNSVGLNASFHTQGFRLLRGRLSIASRALSMRLVQIWLRALPLARIRGSSRSNCARHLNSVLELVLEHAQRHVDTLFDIDFGRRDSGPCRNRS